MTAFAAVVQMAQYALNDLALFFPVLQITDWIQQGVLDMNHHFPRRLTYTVTAVTNQRVYDLETNTLGVISVEYPTSSSKTYLSHLPYTHSEFWSNDGYYDFNLKNDGLTTNKPQLLISTTPGATPGTITLDLLIEHSAVADPISVLDRHLPILMRYVVWKAWVALSVKEAMAPSLPTVEADHLFIAAERAEKSYYQAIAIAKGNFTVGQVLKLVES